MGYNYLVPVITAVFSITKSRAIEGICIPYSILEMNIMLQIAVHYKGVLIIIRTKTRYECMTLNLHSLP